MTFLYIFIVSQWKYTWNSHNNKLQIYKTICVVLQVYDPDVAPLEINVGEIVHLLAKEEELVAARNKAENLERENVDLATELAKKV